MLKKSRFALSAITALMLASSPALAGEELEMVQVGCGGAAFTFPSITFTPFADVVVGYGSEFSVDRTGTGVVIKHIGEAASVRFPSIVSVGSDVSLILDHPGTSYCIDSAVATMGGSIKLVPPPNTHVRVISAVGNVISE